MSMGWVWLTDRLRQKLSPLKVTWTSSVFSSCGICWGSGVGTCSDLGLLSMGCSENDNWNKIYNALQWRVVHFYTMKNQYITVKINEATVNEYVIMLVTRLSSRRRASISAEKHVSHSHNSDVVYSGAQVILYPKFQIWPTFNCFSSDTDIVYNVLCTRGTLTDET